MPRPKQPVTVQVGTTTTANIILQVSQQSTTVEVSGVAPVINPAPSINTTFSQLEVRSCPAPVVTSPTSRETAPGVVVNGTGGYGNFTVNGMPATSNLFTVNGENDMDPYFNINNSGAINLTLGQNEIGEATVITNPYWRAVRPVVGRAGHLRDQVGHQHLPRQRAVLVERPLAERQRLDEQLQSEIPTAVLERQPVGEFVSAARSSRTRPSSSSTTEGMRFVLPNVDQVSAPTPAFVQRGTGQRCGLAAGRVCCLQQAVQPVGQCSGLPGRNRAILPTAAHCSDALHLARVQSARPSPAP